MVRQGRRATSYEQKKIFQQTAFKFYLNYQLFLVIQQTASNSIKAFPFLVLKAVASHQNPDLPAPMIMGTYTSTCSLSL
jgi:hypothetical protein